MPLAKKLRKINDEIGYEVIPGEAIPVFMQNDNSAAYFERNYFVPGTLAANFTSPITLPIAALLVSISAVGGNDNDADFTIERSDTEANIIADAPVGTSFDPNIYNIDDFADTGLIEANEKLALILDYDGSSGTAVSQLTISLLFKVV